MVEIEPIEDLVVIVAGRRLRSIGEHRGVGAFEVEIRASLGREFGMELGVVKRVVVVGDDLHRAAPRSDRTRTFDIPNFTKPRRLAEVFHEDGNPLFAVGIPSQRSAVRYHLILRRVRRAKRIGSSMLRVWTLRPRSVDRGRAGDERRNLQRLPLHRITPRLKTIGAAQTREWIAE